MKDGQAQQLNNVLDLCGSQFFDYEKLTALYTFVLPIKHSDYKSKDRNWMTEKTQIDNFMNSEK